MRAVVQPPLRPLLETLRRLLREGAYLVGGSVRDILLARPIADLDVAVSGEPAVAAEAVAGAFAGAAPFPLDVERRIHRVALPADAPVRYVDLTPIAGDIASDLARRDFTIDAIAAPLAADFTESNVIDPFEGRKDLKKRLVRAVGRDVFREDGLRLLRAVRLAAELDFRIEKGTASLMAAEAARLDGAAAERRREELVRMLETPRGCWALREMDGAGLLARVLPEVTACRGVGQPKEHYWDVFDHCLETVEVLDNLLNRDVPRDTRWASFWRELWSALAWLPDAPAHFDDELTAGHSRRALLKLAGVLHDVGKPETKGPDKAGRMRFLGHAPLGGEKAGAVMRRLRFSAREVQHVRQLVEEHLRPGQMSPPKAGSPPSRRALYRFFRDLGDAAFDLLVLALADHLAARGPRMRITSWRGHVAFVSHVLQRREIEEGIVPVERLVSGRDVMEALALEPGPEVGRILRAVEEAQGAGEIASREEALALAKELAPGRGRAGRRRG